MVMPTAIIIPTRNRPDALQTTLSALRADASTAGMEVIVCDNAAGNERTKAVALAHGVRVIDEPRPGLSRARNAGAAATDADTLLFLDDDISVRQGWAREMTEPIDRREADATVCRIVLPSGADTYGVPPPALAMLMTDESIDPQSPFLACSFAIRRDAFDEAGHFDVNLGVGSGVIPGHEDLLLTLQLKQGQRKIAFVASTEAEHRISPDKFTPDSLMQRLIAGAKSDGWMAYHWFGQHNAHAVVKGQVWLLAAQLARVTPWTRGYALLEGQLRASAAFHTQFARETKSPRKYHH